MTRPRQLAPADRVNLGIIGVAGRAKGNLDEENNADRRPEHRRDLRRGPAEPRRGRGAVPQGTGVPRLPQADRPQRHRRGRRQHAGPHPRRGHAAGDRVRASTSTARSRWRTRWRRSAGSTEAARKHKRVTQMGTQIHAGANYRRTVELVQSGAIGNVSEVHVYQGSQWAAAATPTDHTPVPEYFDYDLWLGPVPYREYHKDYHPASWRRYWAFGNGTIGDMGCHYIDLPFWALGPEAPDEGQRRRPAGQRDRLPGVADRALGVPRQGRRPAGQAPLVRRRQEAAALRAVGRAGHPEEAQQRRPLHRRQGDALGRLRPARAAAEGQVRRRKAAAARRSPTRSATTASGSPRSARTTRPAPPAGSITAARLRKPCCSARSPTAPGRNCSGMRRA